MGAVDAELRHRLDRELFAAVVAVVPDEWLGSDPDRARATYVDFLSARLETSQWLPAVAA